MHILKRLDELPLQRPYSMLPPATVDLVIRSTSELLTTGFRQVQQDISDSSAEQVRRLLLSYQAPDSSVVLVWPADRFGVVILYSDFVAHYDDLWYPSRDDLWVTNYSFGWVIEISHEEVLTLITKIATS